ncbi:SPOR domain-containing protein [Saccharicrinis fermentans]|uniref:SPOR domain-containing protein n=1 Tax=Saccharicrinis fermentans DSM 9555 = JCM 21142 TaxID=869213 RepID=W7Y678_9BACT|nr:SPOR domain-containing protein [Saccharicrinis fermentans]GAF03108.1 hypothetical protein JCM21142_41767 [Saccharicrinis fermentans DSM 9555 = JCM 21142]
MMERTHSVVSESDMSKILKAHSYIAQGNEILFADFVYPKDSLFRQGLTYVELSENLYAGKRVSRLLFETKDYYRTGFESMLTVYGRYINQYLGETNSLYYKKISALKDSVDMYVSHAEEMRGKSLVSAQLRKGGEQIHVSNIQYQQAVLFCLQALDLIEKESALQTQKKGSAVVQDTVGAKVVRQAPTPVKEEKGRFLESSGTEKVYTDLLLVSEEKEVLAVEKEDRAESLVEETRQQKQVVYYTVQIMADKAPVSESRIKQVYSGKYPIVENKGDGWYRYSFGKFGTFSAAKKALVQSNTKGYIVAYRGGDRISLSEAKAWLIQ